MDGEIISLQFGNYSNFAGTHFFNLQDPNGNIPKERSDDDYNANVLWRETKRGSTRTFTPRLLAIDLAENVVSRRSVEAVQQQGKKSTDNRNTQLWDGNVEEIHLGVGGDEGGSGSFPQTPWRFEDGRDSWLDLAKWRFSAEDVYKVPNFNSNPQNPGLSNYCQGLEIWSQMEDSLSDGIRRYAEECDNLQGFNVWVDQEDGISGIAGGVLQHLSDEYDRKCCFGLGFSPPKMNQSGVKDTAFRNRIANVALLWNQFNRYSSVFSSLSLSQNIFSVESVPRVLPFLNYNPESVYESSCIMAATLQTLFSPVTTTNTSSMISLPEISAFLSAFGRKMTTVSSSFPFPCDIRQKSLFATLSESGIESHHSLSPCIGILDIEKTSGNFFAIKGLQDQETIKEGERNGMPSWKRDAIRNIESCFSVFAHESFSKSVNLVKSVQTPTTICYPFPTKVVSSSSLNSYFIDRRYTRGVLDVWDLPILASAHNSCQGGSPLQQLINDVGGGNSRKTHTYFSTCNIDMELDDFVQCIDDLTTLRENYDERLE